VLPAVALAVGALLDCSSGGSSGGSGFGGGDAGVDAKTGAGRDATTDAFPPTAEAAPPVETAPLCTDCDHDGYPAPADCNDNDPAVNPDAYDFVGDGVDNDCDGTVDNPVVTCETIPATAPGTPQDFARAADLCPQRAITHTGKPFDPVVNALWGEVQGTGTGSTLWTSKTKPQQVNIVSSFGQNAAQVGKTMFGLANGPWGATDPRGSPALDPAGFNLIDACGDIPLAPQDCVSLTGNKAAASVSVQDWAELTLWLQVPVNASGLSFRFAFFSSEFNQWWQSAANDAFFALVTSKTLKGTNVAIDSTGLGVTVNSSFFQLCPAPPGPAGLMESAALGQCVGVGGSASVAGSLAGTGYDGAGASSDAGAPDTVRSVSGDLYVYGGGTGWLSAAFPVTPGEQLEVRVVIMDTFDGLKDSVVLVDGFTWQQSPPASVGVSRPK